MRRFIAVLAMLMAGSFLFAEMEETRQLKSVIAEVVAAAEACPIPSVQAYASTAGDTRVLESEGKHTAREVSYGEHLNDYLILKRAKLHHVDGKAKLWLDFGNGEVADLSLTGQTGVYSGLSTSGYPLTLTLISDAVTRNPDVEFVVAIGGPTVATVPEFANLARQLIIKIKSLHY